MKKINIDSLLRYSSISSVSYCPDGSCAMFIVTKANQQATGYTHELMLLENREIVKIDTEVPVNNVTWLDTKHLITGKIGKTGTIYFSVDIHTGHSEKLFEVPFKSGSVQVISEHEFLLTGKIHVEYPDLYKMPDEERNALTDQLEFEEQNYMEIDELPFYYFNSRGFVNKKRTAVFIYNTERDECLRISEPLFTAVSAVTLGKRIYYYGKQYFTKVPSKNVLMEYDMESGLSKVVTDDTRFWIAGICAAEDKLIFLGSGNDKYSYWGSCNLYIYDPVSEELSLLAENDRFTKMGLSSDVIFRTDRDLKYARGSVYFVADERNAAVLFKVDKDGTVSKAVDKEGAVISYSVSPKRDNILASALFDMCPNELYLCKTGEDGQPEIKKMTDYHKELVNDTYIALPEKYTVNTCNETIDGWVLKPYGYDENKQYPAVLSIHGGPLTAYGEVFMNEMQLFASHGYFVFFCNPVGSDGRGNEFADIRGKFGYSDYEMLMDFTDYVLSKYPQIDKTKVCVNGGSYAGFMTNWIIGNTDRFCCACSERSISNWISFYGTADIGSIYAPEHMATDGFTQPEVMWEHSPMKYAINCKTPTLFIQCDDDGCAPLSEAMQMYSVLAANNVPTKLFVFKGENHSLNRTGKPFHKMRRLEEILKWFDKYTNISCN